MYVLPPLLLLIYINDSNEAISHFLIHHFADNTNIIFSNKSLNKISKYINHDLAQIVQWLRVNSTLLNSNKIEIVLFQPKNKKHSKNQTKYLGTYLDEHLTWNF